MSEKKGITSIVVSLLALGVSSLSLYVSSFQQLDEFGVIVDGQPHISFSKEANTFRAGVGENFTFVNTGTRPVVVRSVNLSFRQTSRSEVRSCDAKPIMQDDEDVVSFPYYFDPITVKAGEVFAIDKRLELMSLFGVTYRSPDFRVNEVYAKSGPLQIVACLLFSLVSIGGGATAVELPYWISIVDFSRTKIDDRKDGWIFPREILSSPSKVNVLLKNRGMRF
jgi:hypothetical protein